MSLHDLFRGIFGFPGGRGGRQPPPDYFDENEEWDGDDDDDDEDEEDHDSFGHDFGAFGFRGGPGFEEYSGDDFGMSDMMKHFDEMFHTFDELFRQLGTVEFPPLPPPHRPGVPGIEPPPSGPGHERSLRDRMLKEPGAIPEGGSSRSEQPKSQQPTPKRYPQFEDFWKNPFGQLPPSPWEKPPSSPQDKVDKDLDAHISASDLDTVLPRQQPSQPLQGRSFFKSITTTTIRGPDGKVEQRRTVRDGSGNEETVVTRNDGDQTHTVVTRRDPSGREETREEISDIDQGRSSHPEDRWPGRRPDLRPPTLPGEDGKLLPLDARLVTVFNRIYSNGTMMEEQKVTELGLNQVGTDGGNLENGKAGLSLVTVQNEFHGDAGLDELKDMVRGLQTAVEDLTFLLTEKMDQTDETGLEETHEEGLTNSTSTESKKTANCPPGFVEGPQACYWFSQDKQPYLLAEHVCTTKGGRLAMVKTKQVHIFLGRYIHRTTKASHWIGLTDILKERHFHWSDGTPLKPADYMPWWRRQPDNSRRREHCVELKKAARYKWNDMPCTGLLRYICERDL